MLEGEAEAEISELFAMKDQEWVLCTGGFTGVKIGHVSISNYEYTLCLLFLHGFP